MKVILAICLAAAAADVSVTVYKGTGCTGDVASTASLSPGGTTAATGCVQCNALPVTTAAPATTGAATTAAPVTTAAPTTTAAPATTTTVWAGPTAQFILGTEYGTKACVNCNGASDGCYFSNIASFDCTDGPTSFGTAKFNPFGDATCATAAVAPVTTAAPTTVAPTTTAAPTTTTTTTSACRNSASGAAVAYSYKIACSPASLTQPSMLLAAIMALFSLRQ